MSGLLEGKRVLVTGVLSESSIAFSVARLAQAEGATVILTSFGRALRITHRAATRLAAEVPVIELDVTDAEHLERLPALVGGPLDGVVHAIGYAPAACLGGDILAAEWDDVATTLHVSAFSLKALAQSLLPCLREAGGGSVVALDFDARQAWPVYDWMGVAKAALEATARYLARDLGTYGIRVNLVSAGPLRTIAARSIPGFAQVEDTWADRAPLGWDTGDATPVAKAVVAMLSDWFEATTGEMVHVDGGFHAMALPSTPPEPPA